MRILLLARPLRFADSIPGKDGLIDEDHLVPVSYRLVQLLFQLGLERCNLLLEGRSHDFLEGDDLLLDTMGSVYLPQQGGVHSWEWIPGVDGCASVPEGEARLLLQGRTAGYVVEHLGGDEADAVSLS